MRRSSLRLCRPYLLHLTHCSSSAGMQGTYWKICLKKTYFYWSFWGLSKVVFLRKSYSVNIYLFEVGNRNHRKRCEMRAKLAAKTPTLLTSFWCFYCQFWAYFTRFSVVSIVDFEQVNVSWVFHAFVNLLQKFNRDCY